MTDNWLMVLPGRLVIAIPFCFSHNQQRLEIHNSQERPNRPSSLAAADAALVKAEAAVVKAEAAVVKAEAALVKAEAAVVKGRISLGKGRIAILPATATGTA